MGFGEWNHSYIRGINGEVRLWVFREDHGFGAIVEPPAHDPLRITLADGHAPTRAVAPDAGYAALRMRLQ